jgi:hypothetical protein
VVQAGDGHDRNNTAGAGIISIIPRLAVTLIVAALLAGCSTDRSPSEAAATSATAEPRPSTTATPATTAAASTTTTADPFAPPSWLGRRPLPLRPDGFGEIQPTPAELVDRRIQMPDTLPPPDGEEYQATIDPVPAAVVERSTWNPSCPVTLDELRYLTVTFWGFDGDHHRGELIVNATAADALVEVFRRLHEVRFPIEEMRVINAFDLLAAPTGDGNDTTAFVCRSATAGGSWSQHAYGLAIDVNPFHNPYVRDDVVVPELASAYLDRGRDVPGVIGDGDPVVAAFAAAGWEWGGHWSSLKDYQHFSANGR